MSYFKIIVILKYLKFLNHFFKLFSESISNKKIISNELKFKFFYFFCNKYFAQVCFEHNNEYNRPNIMFPLNVPTFQIKNCESTSKICFEISVNLNHKFHLNL